MNGQGRHGNHARGSSNGKWSGGKTFHPLYDIYNDMKARCARPSHKRYSDYGGRGITVCETWLDSFWNFVEDMGDRPEGRFPSGRHMYSLDRIDNNKGYGPDNCKWSSPSEQALNKRGYGPHPSFRKREMA